MLGDVLPVQIRVEPGHQIIYRSRDNPVSLTFKQWNGRKDSALDFSNITRMVMVFTNVEPQISFDSDLMPDVFTWIGAAPGQIKLELSQFDYPASDAGYEALLIAFDAQHPDGQVLTSREGYAKVTFSVAETYISGTPLQPLPTGDLQSIRRTAGTTVSALRVLYEKQGLVYPVDTATADVFQIMGVSISSGVAGAQIVIQTEGYIEDSSWNWDTSNGGLVFATSGGILTQTPPTIGWDVVVGFATSPTRLNLDMDEPVFLA
jgi:hypothetical protein